MCRKCSGVRAFLCGLHAASSVDVDRVSYSLDLLAGLVANCTASFGS